MIAPAREGGDGSGRPKGLDMVRSRFEHQVGRAVKAVILRFHSLFALSNGGRKLVTRTRLYQ